MRNISFFATQSQIREGVKDVTRRLGWRSAQPGELLQPIEKGQGLKKGEKVVALRGPIMLVRVDFEPLFMILDNPYEVFREGFPSMTAKEFVHMFCKMNKCTPFKIITRLEFKYTDGGCKNDL